MPHDRSRSTVNTLDGQGRGPDYRTTHHYLQYGSQVPQKSLKVAVRGNLQVKNKLLDDSPDQPDKDIGNIEIQPKLPDITKQAASVKMLRYQQKHTQGLNNSQQLVKGAEN